MLLNSRVILVLCVILSTKSFSQEIIFYSDTITIDPKVNSEKYYAVKGKFIDVVKSPVFNDFSWFVNQVLTIKSEKKLNDYFTYEVIVKYSDVYFTKKNSIMHKAAFVYSVLRELGFDMKVTSSDKYSIYIYSAYDIYRTGVLHKSKREYYKIYPFIGSDSYNYEINLPKKSSPTRSFDLRIRESPRMINSEYIQKKITFELDSVFYEEYIVLNKTLIFMLKNYPRASFCIYGQSVFSDSLRHSFEKKILPRLKNINDSITVRNILAFSRTVADYKKDSYKEKFMFPEEFIFYNKGDCEDYSFLFAYLVQEYTKLKTVYINYPNDNHVNVGVNIPSKLGGLVQRFSLDGEEYFEKLNSIKLKGEEYYVCEPTGNCDSCSFGIGEAYKYEKYEVVDCDN